ncbi:MAG: antitoxin VapB family protein [Candidatus Heimdallarchaeota archaeon]|nr:antitoxin VapB family protein [Candidatus Heimdallarchaeota archaeon]
METKSIDLSDEAYKKLLMLKKENESFSELILRLTKTETLRDFIGLLSEETCEKIERNIEENREKRSKTFSNKINNIVKDLGEEN